LTLSKEYAQQEGIEYEATFAAIAKMNTIIIAFVMEAQFGYKVHQIDVKSALLNEYLEE